MQYATVSLRLTFYQPSFGQLGLLFEQGFLDNKSPYEKLTSRPPDYQWLKSFGCLCYSSTIPKCRYKFESRAKACVFLGNPSGFKGYKILDLETHTVSISGHVIYHEDVFPFVSSTIRDATKDLFPLLPLPGFSHVPFASYESIF